MGWIDDILSQTGRAVPAPGFPLLPQEDGALQAAEARQVMQDALTARRAARGAPRPPSGPWEKFGQDQVPYSMGMLSPMGMNWPAGPDSASEPAAPGLVAPDMPPSTNDPMSREPVLFQNGVPLPRPNPAGLGETPDIGPGPNAPFSMAPEPAAAQAQAALPPNAAPTVGATPPGLPTASAPAPAGGGFDAGGILGKIFNPANAPMLLAMGGGFAGAPSLGTGMRRGFTAAAPQAALLRKEQVSQSTMAETYRALVARGVPPQDAIAAVRNPEIMKALVAKHFETQKPTVHDITGPLGDKTPVVFDPNTRRFTDMSGNPVGGSTGGTGGMGEILAPGVKYDPNATGEDYFNQFSKDVQAAARAYMNGDTIPSGNPRQKAIASFAKTVAQRYGQDMGIPVTDASYAQKRNLIADFGRGIPSSLGGQRNSGGTAMGHLDTLGKQLVELGNVSLPGGYLPGVAGLINIARQNLTEEQKAKANAVNNTLDRYVAEVGKYYAGSQGGGVHEREAARQRFNTAKTGPELAAAVASERELFHSKLMQLQEQADTVLGDQRERLVGPILQPHAKEAYERLQGHIDALRGVPAARRAPTAAPAASPAAPPPGRYVLDPASGRLVPQR